MGKTGAEIAAGAEDPSAAIEFAADLAKGCRSLIESVPGGSAGDVRSGDRFRLSSRWHGRSLLFTILAVPHARQRGSLATCSASPAISVIRRAGDSGCESMESGSSKWTRRQFVGRSALLAAASQIPPHRRLLAGALSAGAADLGQRSEAAAVSSAASSELDERSQRSDLLERTAPHVLPVQPERRVLGRYALGARGESGHGSLAPSAGCIEPYAGRIRQ